MSYSKYDSCHGLCPDLLLTDYDFLLNKRQSEEAIHLCCQNTCMNMHVCAQSHILKHDIYRWARYMPSGMALPWT